MMRTGVIVYVIEKDFPFEKEPELAAEIKQFHQADEVEIVSCGQKHYDVMDAWWRLTARGMQKFICIFAGYGKTSQPAETSRCHLRLCQ